MKRKRLIILSAVAVTLTAAFGGNAFAQTLGDVGAATAAGATIGAAGGVATRSPSQYAAPATSAAGQRGSAMEGMAGGGSVAGIQSELAGNPAVGQGPDGAPAGEGAEGQTKAEVVRSRALHWSNDNGYDMLRGLLINSNGPKKLNVQQKARRANSFARPPKDNAWINFYQRSDRSRVTNGTWKFVTTPEDRYYYRPWAPAIRLRNPSRIIGFNSWQDAMVAGYRPDPDSWPDPAPQLLYISTLTNSLEFAHYVEFVFAGQMTPATFNSNFKYIRYVENLANQREDTRKEKSLTISLIVGAALGYNDVPRYIGGKAWIEQEKKRRAEEEARLRKDRQERERYASQIRYNRAANALVGAFILGALLGASL